MAGNSAVTRNPTTTLTNPTIASRGAMCLINSDKIKRPNKLGQNAAVVAAATVGLFRGFKHHGMRTETTNTHSKIEKSKSRIER